MRTINISEFKKHLSAYLKHVRNGEEIIIRDGDRPIARIVPVPSDPLSEHEWQLVASGAITLPQEKMDWDKFFAISVGDVSHEDAVQAAIESRGKW